MKKIALLYIALTALPAAAQYAPQAGVAGSNAINKTDNRFVEWATGCTIERGWLDIADKPQGKAALGLDINATGKADNSIVSLGDSGVAVLTFASDIYNGPGADFAVFENGFLNPNNLEESFMELAFVEVSSDGVNYVRFPASSLTDTPQVPMAGVFMNARKVNNLAGKYISNFGTPFDLEELKNEPGLDVGHITHIRLVDVVGSLGNHASRDKDSNIINDPYPSPIAGCGFDLDAVGVLYMLGRWPSDVVDVTLVNHITLYPNPAREALNITSKQIQTGTVIIKDVTGRQITTTQMYNGTAKADINHLPQGVYYLILNDENGETWVERFNKY